MPFANLTRTSIPVAVIIFVLTFASFSCCVWQMPTAKAATYPAWDFEDHSYTHPFLTALSPEGIAAELQNQNAIFAQYGLPPPLHMAYPSGDYNNQVISVVSQYRLSGRLANDGATPTVYPVGNWYTLGSKLLSPTTTFDSIKSLIDTAVANNALLNLFTHDVANPPRTSGGCTATLLGQILDYLVSEQNAGHLLVLTMRQAYATFNGQKAVVVISFDDGWITDYTTAWPMFKARGLAGTSFIVGSVVGNGNPDEINWAQVQEMAQGSTPQPEGWAVTITSDPSRGGSTNPSGQLTGLLGSLSVTGVPLNGYHLSNWLFDGNVLTGNPVVIPRQEDGSSHTLTAVFSQNQLVAQVATDRDRYGKWSYVDIAVLVTNGDGDALQGAYVTVNVYDPHGSVVWTSSSVSNPNGQAAFVYKLVFDAQMGTYTIAASVTRSGYPNTNAQTTFYSLG
jgi:peptidoglycan/xylan/chitin deacetylase (PgdA/CDA1 family)